MRIITGCNAPYLPRMAGYLDSLRRHATFPVTFIGVGFEPSDIEGIETATITHEQNAGAPERTECIQHGSFLSVVDGPEDEVLVYTDGDFTMQRKLERDELDLLDLDHFEAVTSWNGGEHETLTLEAGRLGMRSSTYELQNAWRDMRYMSIYNVGFLAMTRRTWREVYSAYMADWQRVCAAFEHPARQQWLISYEMQRLRLAVKIAPWSLHAHGHFGLKPGMEMRPDGVYHNGRLAAFRHYL